MLKIKYAIFYALMCSILTLASWSTKADDWPKEIVNADNSRLVLDQPPTRILSTSVTVTGTLLAIDAPVVASASATTNRFFAQWEKVAHKRGVQNVWPAGRVDFEAAYEVQPDLIIVSLGGADSAMAHLDMLRAIAPVMIVDYASTDWQGLARQLGDALGIEDGAERRIEGFNRHVKQVKGAIAKPEGEVTIVSYNGPGIINPIGIPSGSHGRLLRALGFDVVAPAFLNAAIGSAQGDFVRTEYEQLTHVTAQTVFLLRRKVFDNQGFLNDAVLQNLPSVQNKQVWGLGENSFRMDFYSATETVNNIASLFTPK